MGNNSSQFPEFLPNFFSHVLSEEPTNTLLTEEIHSLTYSQFLSLMGELNLFTRDCLDTNGKQLIFAVKKGTDSTIFWKATVQIACVKIDPETQKVETYRLLTLSEFLKVFKTLKCQRSAAEHSNASDLSVSTILHSLEKQNSKDSINECCICFERPQEVILPCAHSYCHKCIEEWNESHDTCPICREKLESPDDTWELSEVPRAEEICKEIKENIAELTEEPSGCNPS